LLIGELKCRGTYMSENALLIDLMEARASHQEAHSARGFHNDLLALPELAPSGCGDNCSQVVDWIDAQLRGLDRVEAYRQEFQTDEAAALRTNVYGILRASPLADGKVGRRVGVGRLDQVVTQRL
jgi:glycosylphosphatidylinositol transamidase